MDNVKELRERLLIKKKNGGRILAEEEIRNAEKFSKGYKIFLDEGKTEREAIFFAVNEAKKKGFEEFNKEREYKPGDKIYCVNKEKFLILAVIGKNGLENGIKMAKLPAEGIKTFLQMRLKGRRMPENRRWDAASLPFAICFFIWEAPAGPIVSGKMKITSIESCRRKSIKLIIILFIIYWGKFPPGEIMG